MAMFGETFWSNALANLFATIIGIIIGLPLALWIDRIARARNEKEKSKEAEQRAVKILTLLDSELKYNYDALDKFHQDISNNFFPVRTESWDSFSDGGELQWINDPELLHHLSDAYAEIDHFASIFDKYVDADLFPKSVGAPELKERILQSVLRVRNTTLNQIKSTQSFIKKKLEQ